MHQMSKPWFFGKQWLTIPHPLLHCLFLTCMINRIMEYHIGGGLKDHFSQAFLAKA